VFNVRFGFIATMMDDAISMIWWRIQRIEFECNATRIDDVVMRPSLDYYREAGFDRGANAIENCLASSLLDAEKLVKLMDFGPDLFRGLQRHNHKLTVPSRVKYAAKVIVLDRDIFDVLYEALHSMAALGAEDVGIAFAKRLTCRSVFLGKPIALLNVPTS
jgi:hypothetical protein